MRHMTNLYFKAVAPPQQVVVQIVNGAGLANGSSLLELFASLWELLGIQLEYRRYAPRGSDQRVFVADIGNAFRVFGCAPRMSVREGIEAILGRVDTFS